MVPAGLFTFLSETLYKSHLADPKSRITECTLPQKPQMRNIYGAIFDERALDLSAPLFTGKRVFEEHVRGLCDNIGAAYSLPDGLS